MIVTDAQINRLHRGGRVELDVDFRPTVGETYAAQLEKGLKRALDVSVIGAEKLEPGRWRVLVVKGSRVEKPLLLKARPGTDDYTERSGLAMPDEPEPIDPKARDAYAARARQAADEKRKASRGAPGDLQIHIDAARRAERALFEELDERYVDWTPHQIAEHAPHQGNPAEIRERRRRHQRRAVDGRIPLDEKLRAETEAWLRATGAPVREIERALDVSYRRALDLHHEWRPEAEAA